MFHDPVLKQLINRYPPPQWTDRSDYLFEDLIETIISQQLSGKAADSIFRRFKALFQTKTFPVPEEVLRIEQGSLRQIGISRAKAAYIHNIAQAFVNKEIEVKTIRNMSDEEVMTVLTKVKGIGKWSAEMILIFTLNRPDVFSLGDLGLRKAIGNLYGITEEEKVLKLTQSWSPNRSLACWYLWRSLENR